MAFQSPWVSGSGGSPWGFATSTPKSHQRSLFSKIAGAPFRFIGNLASDIKNAAVGLPTGLLMMGKHPLRSFEDMGKSMWQDWSPYFAAGAHMWAGYGLAITGQEKAAGRQFSKAGHDFKTFATQFYAHPLAPLLDIATVFTGGAGAVGKIAKFSTRTEWNNAVKLASIDAAKQGFTKSGRSLQDFAAIYNIGTPEHAALVEAGGGINIPSLHASVSRKAMLGRAQSRAFHGRGADSGITLYKPLAANPYTRWKQEMRLSIGENLAQFAPKWFGEHAAIRDLSSAGQFNRLAAKNFAEHNAAHSSIMAGALQMYRMLDSGKAINDNPYEVAQFLHEQHRPQFEHRSTEFKVNADTWTKTNKAGDLTHIKAPEGWSLVLKDPVTVPKSLFKNNTAQEFYTYAKEKFGALNATARKAPVDNLYRGPEGNFRIIRSDGLKKYGDEYAESSRFVTNLVKRPTNVWKRLVLAPAPRYFLNNAVGNMFMFLTTSNVHSVRALVEGYRNVLGDKTAYRALSKADREIATKLGAGWNAMERHYGQTYKQGTAAEQVASITPEGKLHGPMRRRLGQASRGFLPITHQVAERSLRRAAGYGFLRAQPEVRAMMKSGHSFDTSVELLSKDPAFHARVTQATNDVLGDYHYLTKLEQQIRNFVPFYTWLRAITRHTGALVRDHPGRAVTLTYAGQLGVEKTKEILGDIPDFLAGAMPLELLGFHHAMSTRAGIVTTQGLNPYASIPQAMEAVRMLTTGTVRPNEALASILGPLPAGVIEATTGQSLLSGKRLDKYPGGLLTNIGIRQFMNTPVPRLFTQVQQGTVTEHKGKATLYKQDLRTALAALLGVPVKNMSMDTALNLALAERGEKKPRKSRKSPFINPGGGFVSPWTKTTI